MSNSIENRTFTEAKDILAEDLRKANMEPNEILRNVAIVTANTIYNLTPSVIEENRKQKEIEQEKLKAERTAKMKATRAKNQKAKAEAEVKAKIEAEAKRKVLKDIKEPEEFERLIKKQRINLKKLVKDFDRIRNLSTRNNRLFNIVRPLIGEDQIVSRYLIGDYLNVRYITNVNVNNLQKFYNNISKKVNEVIKIDRVSNKIINPDSDVWDPQNVISYYFQQAKLIFQNKDDEKIILVRVISDTDLSNFETFKRRVEGFYQEENKVPGSDMIEEDRYELIFEYYDIIYRKDAVGFGDGKFNFFKVKGIDSKEGLCGLESLRYFNVDISEEEYKTKELHILKNMHKYIDDNKLDIEIFHNHISIDREYYNNKDIGKDEYVDGIRYQLRTTPISISEKGVRLYKSVLYSDRTDFIRSQFFRLNKKCIIYDYKSEHYDVLISNELDNIYTNGRLDFFKRKDDAIISLKYRNYVEATKHFIEKDKKIFVEDKFIFFDYEGVVDFKENSITKPYSLSYIIMSKEDLINLSEWDKKGQQSMLEMIKQRAEVYIGYDCSKYLIERIVNSIGERFTLVSFNGSNYDNLILYNDWANSSYNDILGEPFYSKSSLLNFKICGSHDMFDLRRHLIGSLSMNCQSFGVKCLSKSTFDHSEAQRMYDEDPVQFIKYMKNNEELKEYNKLDVLSLAIIYHRYQEAITSIEGMDKIVLNNHKTIGSMSMFRMKQYWKSKDISFPTFVNKKNQTKFIKYYSDILKYKVAGRVELFNGLQIINEQIYSMDVCSLYPYVMAIYDAYYPKGEIVEFAEGETIPDDLIGYYYCDIDQSKIRAKGLMNVYPEKTETENNWGSEKKLKKYLMSTVDIKTIKKFGGKVKLYNGFYFTEKIKGCEAFEPLLNYMNIKNTQDTLKSNEENGIIDDKKRYNACLRETIKLLSNSISGKLIEGLHNDKTELIKPEAVNHLTMKELKIVGCFNNKMLINYKLENEDIFNESKPIYLGALVYSYARQYMYEHIISKVSRKNMFYTDTDSCKINQAGFEEWLKHASNTVVPHWKEVEKFDKRFKNHKIYQADSKVYGSFENEYKPDFKTHYFIAKKQYLSGNGTKWKMSFKGVGCKDNLLINPNVVLDNEGKLDIKKAQNFSNNSDTKVGNNLELIFKLMVYCYRYNNLTIPHKDRQKELIKLYYTNDKDLNIYKEFEKNNNNDKHGILRVRTLSYLFGRVVKRFKGEQTCVITGEYRIKKLTVK